MVFFKLGGDGNMFMASLILKVAQPEPAPIFTFSSSQEVFFCTFSSIRFFIQRSCLESNPLRLRLPTCVNEKVLLCSVVAGSTDT